MYKSIYHNRTIIHITKDIQKYIDIPHYSKLTLIYKMHNT